MWTKLSVKKIEHPVSIETLKLAGHVDFNFCNQSSMNTSCLQFTSLVSVEL